MAPPHPLNPSKKLSTSLDFDSFPLPHLQSLNPVNSTFKSLSTWSPSVHPRHTGSEHLDLCRPQWLSCLPAHLLQALAYRHLSIYSSAHATLLCKYLRPSTIWPLLISAPALQSLCYLELLPIRSIFTPLFSCLCKTLCLECCLSTLSNWQAPSHSLSPHQLLPALCSPPAPPQNGLRAPPWLLSTPLLPSIKTHINIGLTYQTEHLEGR